jgi:hypothetical protein
MNNFFKYTKLMLFFTVLTPYLAVLYNSIFIAFFSSSSYLENSKNRIIAYFNDATYLFIVQFIPRVCFITIALILSNICFQFLKIKNSKHKRICSCLIVGLMVGAILSIPRVALFINIGLYNYLETVSFYLLLGLLYGLLVSIFIDSKDFT